MENLGHILIHDQCLQLYVHKNFHLSYRRPTSKTQGNQETQEQLQGHISDEKSQKCLVCSWAHYLFRLKKKTGRL